MRSHRSRRYRRSPQRLYSPARSRAQGVWANQDLLEAPPGELAVSTTATTSVSTTTIGAGEKIPTFYSFSSTSVTGIIRCADGWSCLLAVRQIVQTTESWFSHFGSLFEACGVFAGKGWYHGYWLEWVENCFTWSQLLPFFNRTTGGNSTILCFGSSSAQNQSWCFSRYATRASKGSTWQKHFRSDSLTFYSRYESRQLCSHHAWRPFGS